MFLNEKKIKEVKKYIKKEIYAFLFTRNVIFKLSSSLVMLYLNFLLQFELPFQCAQTASVTCPFIYLFIFIIIVIFV